MILYKNDGVDLRLSYRTLVFAFHFYFYDDILFYNSKKLAAIFILFGFIWTFLEFQDIKFIRFNHVILEMGKCEVGQIPKHMYSSYVFSFTPPFFPHGMVSPLKML